MKELFLSLAIYALAIVISLLVAALIRGIVVILALLRETPAPTLSAAPTVNKAAAASAQDDIAAITAAVYAVMGAHRIVRIEARDRSLAWKSASRASHHASHDIPRPRRR